MILMLVKSVAIILKTFFATCNNERRNQLLITCFRKINDIRKLTRSDFDNDQNQI